MRRLVVLVALAALTAVPAFAQDAAREGTVTGTWEVSVESPQGPMTITATYKQEGEKLTGMHVSEMGEAPLEGTVKGSEFTYVLTIQGPDGPLALKHTGKVDGDTITGTVELFGDTIPWTAKRKK
ncbi:MAG TPA: hypothetical protein PKK95_06620 [Vicinamibacterales bacterium]|nr:hypothetical protein [Vicinamibacterales bacterium]